MIEADNSRKGYVRRSEVRVAATTEEVGCRLTMKSVLLFCVFAISPFAQTQTTGASPVATPDKPPATGTKTKTKKVTGSASTVKKSQGDPGKVAASAAPLNDSAPAPKVQTPKTAET